jgi:hypothetical protein
LSASTHRQALTALIFLCDQVLGLHFQVKNIDIAHRTLVMLPAR